MYAHEREERAHTYRPRVLSPYPPAVSTPEAAAALTRYLTQRNLSPDIARANGWYMSDEAGDDALRIVIPAANSGDFPFWQARAVQPDVEPRYQSPHGVPREDSVVVVWPSPDHTAGIVAVVEGPMDALAAAGVGVVGVSLMGATPPFAVYDYIARRFRAALLLVIPDQDIRKSGARSVRELAQRGCLVQLRLLPAGFKDLADLPPGYREDVIFHRSAGDPTWK